MQRNPFNVSETFELSVRIKLNTAADFRLEFDITGQTGAVWIQDADGSNPATPPVEARIPPMNSGESHRDIAPILDDMGAWQISLDEDGSLFDFLDCSSSDARIHMVLIPTEGIYKIFQVFSEQIQNNVMFRLPDVLPGEYVIFLRKVCHCGNSNKDDGKGLLPEGKVNRVIQSCYMAFYDAALEYAVGLLVKREFRQHARNVLYGPDVRSFCEFSGGLRYRFTQSTWGRAQEDYLMWQNGDVPCSNEGTPWLIVSGDASKEASSADKCQFFRLLEAFHVGLDFFEPAPQEIVNPERDHVHSYFDGEAVRIGFHCVSDGGLLSDPSPCGKTFELRSDKGLKAVLHVKAVNGIHQPAINTFGYNFDFRCVGYVEGYTAENRGESDIYVILSPDGRIEHLGLLMDGRDEKVFSSFPLWGDFLTWRRKKACQYAEAEELFFDSFLFQTPPSMWR